MTENTKPYTEYRKAREVEPWIEVTQREAVPPTKPIKELTHEEQIEYWQRLKILLFELELEIFKETDE